MRTFHASGAVLSSACRQFSVVLRYLERSRVNGSKLPLEEPVISRAAMFEGRGLEQVDER